VPGQADARSLQDDLHAELVTAFSKQGYHILCEKPMATSVDDCVKMVKEVEAAPDTIFGIGHGEPGFSLAPAHSSTHTVCLGDVRVHVEFTSAFTFAFTSAFTSSFSSLSRSSTCLGAGEVPAPSYGPRATGFATRFADHIPSVLRYSPYNRAVKEVIDSGALGEIINIQHIEPVGNQHFAHSFVRGNWHKEDETSFALMTKSCQ
jgi:hypothetical protein